MKKYVNPESVAIQKRFFQALELAISLGKITGLKGFCNDHNFNRIKYQNLRNSLDAPIEQSQYKSIDIDALAALCLDFDVSPEWLLLGKGKMLKPAKNEN